MGAMEATQPDQQRLTHERSSAASPLEANIRSPVAFWFALLAGWIVFLAMIQVLTLGLSLMYVAIGHRTTKAILVLSMLAGGAAWALVWRVAAPAEEPASAGSAGRFARAMAQVVVRAAVLAYLLAWVWAYCCRDNTGDGNLYHIPPIHFWHMARRICWIDDRFWVASLMNGYPKATELVAYVVVEAARDSHWINCGNLMFMPLGVLGIICISRLLGASGATALVAGFAWVLLPVNIGQSINTSVDSAYGSAVAATLACVGFTYEACHGRHLRSPWPAWLALGAAAGLATGTKGVGIMVAVLSVGFLSMMLLWEKCRDRGAGLSGGWRSVLLGPALAGAMTLGVGGFWLIRNYVVKGSPLYPAGLVVCGQQLFPGPPVKRVICELPNTPPEIVRWPGWAKVAYTWSQWGFRDHWPKTIYGCASRLGGLGYLWLLGCLPAILACLILLPGRPPGQRGLFLLLLAVLGGSFLLTPMNWWARYTVWLYALGLPCFAWALSGQRPAGGGTVPQGACSRRVPAQLWGGACVAVLLIEAFLAWRFMWGSAWTTLRASSIDISRNQWKCLYYPQLNGTTMDTILAGRSAVAVHLDFFAPLLLGELAQPVGRRQIYPLNGPIDAAKLDWLKEQNVQFVIWEEKNGPVPKKLVEASTRVVRGPRIAILTMRWK